MSPALNAHARLLLILAKLLGGVLVAVLAVPGARAGAPVPTSVYQPIEPTMADQTVVLTGKDLRLEDVVRVARFGAKVRLSPEARRRSEDAYGLLLEAAAEGISVYWFNRGSGSNRQKFIFTGDPLSPANRKFLEERQAAIFARGAAVGLGPEIDAEEVVRAMLLIRANSMTYEAASPQLTERLLALLNDRITPVVQSRSTVGEGDLGPYANVGAVMIGAGTAYYAGERMPAREALVRAGLAPLVPFAADDSALESSNGYATALAALALYDARDALAWADLALALDLNGMNSSVSPLAAPVQANRPFRWLNWHAARMLDVLRGSYLFDLDDKRIIQDPESLRASSIRQASAWAAWGQLRDDVVVQMNSSDHNPAVRVGAAPGDSWELATPQLAQFYVKGGAYSKGKHGYVLSNANWDPYPMANDVEAFTIALGNMDAAIAQRILRFSNPFFTITTAPPGMGGGFERELDSTVLMQEIQGLMNPVPPVGVGLVQTVEDLQAQSRLKLTRARAAIADTLELVADDLLTGSAWMDIRRSEHPDIEFGPVTTAVWTALRREVPAPSAAPAALATEGAADASRGRPTHELATAFLRAHSAETFYPASTRQPPGGKAPAGARNLQE
jgi:histidine ammonia-lyase